VTTLIGKVTGENQIDIRDTRTKFYTTAMTSFRSTLTHFRQLTTRKPVEGRLYV